MASIGRDTNGTRRILFVAPDGTRKTIRLGKVSQRSAEGFKLRVEQLLEVNQLNRPMDSELTQWASNLEPRTVNRLAAVGLLAVREMKAEITLGAHVSDYFRKRTDVKQSTLIHWRQAERCLLDYFGASRTLSSITAGDARDWERWLRTGAARKRLSDAKQFFQDAVSRDTLAKNPFLGLKGAVGSNRERDFFIDRDTAAKVLDACPDAEWRLIFALSRFGGLRCPSEHLALTWEDVDFDKGRMLIRSSKTEHHEGKGTRVMPIFPELMPHLEAVFDAADVGAVYVINRYREGNANLRTQLGRILRRAKVRFWPKLFQNLRASRATELAAEHPAHVAAAWLGHSTLVAAKHYWQVTDSDFEKATNGQKSTEEKAAQNPAQQPHAESRFDSHPATTSHEQTLVLREFASACEIVHKSSVGLLGLEPRTNGLKVRCSNQLSYSPANILPRLLQWATTCSIGTAASDHWLCQRYQKICS